MAVIFLFNILIKGGQSFEELLIERWLLFKEVFFLFTWM